MLKTAQFVRRYMVKMPVFCCKGFLSIPRKLNQNCRIIKPIMRFLFMIWNVCVALLQGEGMPFCFKKEGRCPS